MKDLGLLQLLRYALSGGIGMAVLFLTYPAAGCTFHGMDVTKETTLILGSVLLIGALIYNVHRAVIFPVFLRIIGFLTRWDFNWGSWASWKKLLTPWIPSEPELEVDRWRWAREEKKRLRWDEWGAQTHSLYCAAWATFAALRIGHYVWGSATDCRAPHIFWTLFVVLFVAGIVNNYRLLFSIVAEMQQPAAKVPHVDALVIIAHDSSSEPPTGS